uniref:Sushi domain-containing protein n=1 Tax=Octopus bimaculoides TaxID=37653 RepID=A0A0L8FJ32_OCTBM
MRRQFKDRHFNTAVKIQSYSQKVFDSLTENDFQAGFQKWEERWDWCIAAQATTELCDTEPPIANAKFEKKEGILKVSCLNGYVGTKSLEEIKCQNGKWRESEINCRALSPCGKEPTIAHVNVTHLQPGTLEVSCQEGYKGTKEVEIVTCQNKTWTQSEINCTDLCTILPNITNAEVELKKPGVAKVTCLEGYQGEIDEYEISCKDGIWKQEKISCTVQNVKIVSENQMLKFTQFLLSAALHKRYLLCVFLTQNQTCDCLLGKLEFKKWEKKKIVSHNDERISNISLEECTTKCKNKRWCVSFEYSEKYRICHLSKTAQYMLNQLLFVKEKSVNYYEKVCLNEP